MPVRYVQCFHRIEQVRELVDLSSVFHRPRRVPPAVIGDDIVKGFAAVTCKYTMTDPFGQWPDLLMHATPAKG